MKIAIINITGGGMSGGYIEYLRNVIPRMALHPSVEALLCASPLSINVQDWFEPLPNVEFVSYKPYRFLNHRFDLDLRKYLERFSPDVIFVPVERSFWFNEIPIVNMIQNMEPFGSGIDGNPFVERFKHWVQYVDGKKATKKANKVIAVSKFVRDFLIHTWNIPNEKIGLIYHGIGLPKKDDVQRPSLIPKGWEGRFLFTAGSIRPARGLEDIFGAMKNLNNKSRDISGLVIAGLTTPGMERYQKQLVKWVQKNNLSSKICWAGCLSEREMAWCYQNCLVFVMTSRVESFGTIAGEAMAHGCVCISADNPCLPEIFSDTAIYYPAKNGKALAEAIQTTLSWDDIRRKEMSEKARKRAGEFSWDVCAEKTIAELAKVVRR